MTASSAEPAPVLDPAPPAGGALLPRSRGAHGHRRQILGEAPPPTSGADEAPPEETLAEVPAAPPEPEPAAAVPAAPVALEPARRPLVRVRAVLQDGVVGSWLRPIVAASPRPGTASPRS